MSSIISNKKRLLDLESPIYWGVNSVFGPIGLQMTKYKLIIVIGHAPGAKPNALRKVVHNWMYTSADLSITPTQFNVYEYEWINIRTVAFKLDRIIKICFKHSHRLAFHFNNCQLDFKADSVRDIVALNDRMNSLSCARRSVLTNEYTIVGLIRYGSAVNESNWAQIVVYQEVLDQTVPPDRCLGSRSQW